MLIPIILSGGMGTRLWPISNNAKPKQFQELLPNGQNSFQHILENFTDTCLYEKIIICCNKLHINLIEKYLPVGLDPQIFLEPMVKNTSVAIDYTTKFLEKSGFAEQYVAIFPSDIFFENFQEIKSGLEFILKQNDDYLYSFGSEILYPNSNFGYIKLGENLSENCYKVQNFIEKPNLKLAKSFMKDGNYYWNSGIFIGKVKTFRQEFESFSQENLDHVTSLVENISLSSKRNILDPHNFEKILSSRIDQLIMEKTAKLKVIKLKSKWYDLGNWESLISFSNKNSYLNPKIDMIDSTNCYAYLREKKGVLLGLKDIIIIEHEENLLITTKKHAKNLQKILGEFNEKNLP